MNWAVFWCTESQILVKQSRNKKKDRESGEDNSQRQRKSEQRENKTKVKIWHKKNSDGEKSFVGEKEWGRLSALKKKIVSKNREETWGGGSERHKSGSWGRGDGSFVTVRSVCFSFITARARSGSQPGTRSSTFLSRAPLAIYPPTSASTWPHWRCPRAAGTHCCLAIWACSLSLIKYRPQ